MSLTSIAGISSLTQLATIFGINTWDIQDASWNGYTFATSNNSILGRISSSGTAIGSLTSSATNIINSTKQVIGTDPKAGSIPIGANMQSYAVTDTLKRKLVINSLPNSRDNIRGMGYEGQSITIIALDWGTNYISGLKNNILQMFLSDQIISPYNTNYHILVHPFLGRITNAWLAEVKIVHVPNKWRSCIYELKFVTAEPIGIKKVKKSTYQRLFEIVSGIISIATNLKSLWGTFNMLFVNHNIPRTLANNTFILSQLKTTQAAVLDSVNNSVVVTKLLVSKLAPTFSNISLNNFTTIESTIKSISYYYNHTTPQNINNLNDLLIANINSTINLLYEMSGNYYYDTINNLQALIAQISICSSYLLQSYYGDIINYIIPYDMNLYMACSLNNLNYDNNYEKIITLNQGSLFWLNKLNKGTSLILPLASI